MSIMLLLDNLPISGNFGNLDGLGYINPTPGLVFLTQKSLTIKRKLFYSFQNNTLLSFKSLEMASFNCFILAFFMALSFSSINAGLAARHLLQLPPLPPMPTLPGATLPPLPSIPNLPQPTIPTLPQPSLPKPSTLPPLPSLPTLPTIPTGPKVTLPPLPSLPSIPTMPTTIPSIPFFSPPPAKTSP
ncbi:RNA-binding protein 12-like [Durio zibethinus]|uniref:RNA-binding protein 12-like n=1 Tax=Durio zibethinus TaxID=66656 RepID=A0A6P6AB69_DURZI|nr:RNA-binding protein 12-like [Durio zibethinus]